MTLESLIQTERKSLVSRLAFALGGDHHAAEDLTQETITRAWQSMPAGLSPDRQRAWLRRASRNLAIDELRRRSRKPAVALDSENAGSATASAAAEPDAARDALARLRPHERFVLLLYFEGGFSHAEIARLLAVSEEAARKRVARARAAFLNAYRAARAGEAPLVLLVVRDTPPEPYVEWLQRSGARVRRVDGPLTDRELALADGLVFTGAYTDIHSALYGEDPRSLRGNIDLARDRLDLAAVSAAIALDLPMVGVCRGHQLLNIASGGSLYQDILADGVTRVEHGAEPHVVNNTSEGLVRRLAGRSVTVSSEHHQAVRRLGRHLRVTATSPDGVIESIERRDRRFMLGLQWHPECLDSRVGPLVGEALVQAGAARLAA